MEFRPKREGVARRQVLLEWQGGFFQLRWHPHERTKQSCVGGSVRIDACAHRVTAASRAIRRASSGTRRRSQPGEKDMAGDLTSLPVRYEIALSPQL
jgi:hypothetical protein